MARSDKRTHPWLDLPDDRVQMGVIAGLLWLLLAAVVLLAALLPGGHTEDRAVTSAIGAYALVFGIGSFTGWIPWARSGPALRAVAYLISVPVFVTVLWVTGGATSYALPLMSLPLFFAAYFYPARVAWPLVAATVAAVAAPLVYDPAAVADGFAARYVAFAVAGVALAGVVIGLKRRLVASQLEQRRMAFRDPLTGLGNRRAFDAALTHVIEDAGRALRPAAVLFLDLDRFKQVNDRYGHEAGDRALREVAGHCLHAVRPCDALARIGGDEFALVAPEAGADGAERLAAVLTDAVRRSTPAEGAGRLDVTVSWALLGEDGDDGDALMRAADRRLHDAKRRRPAQAPASA